MSLLDFGSYPEDEFFSRVNRQIRDNHREVSDRNRAKRRVWAQSPAMQIASNLIQGPFGLEPEGEAEYAQLLERMREALLREPLVTRYANHLEHSNLEGRSNTEWWHALGHQYMVACMWSLAQSRAEAWARKSNLMPTILDERLWNGAFEGVGPREIAFEWAGRTLEAKTYLWHQNTLDAALSAPLVPHVVQPNALPFESVFFSFEYAAFVEEGFDTSIAVLGEDTRQEVPVRAETWWIMVTRLGDAGMMFHFDRQIWPRSDSVPQFVPQDHFVFEPITWGARWPEDFENRPFKWQIGAVLRMLAFMQAPFVDTTLLERRLPRPIRREYDRKGKEAPLKEVSIITLRAALHEPFYPNGQEDGEVNHDRYKHSWWVNGHYRWQWYPREQTHKLIPIAQYMKQKGKPVLIQIRDVKR